MTDREAKAWVATDDLHPYIKGIVTTNPETVQAWRDSGIAFSPLYPEAHAQCDAVSDAEHFGQILKDEATRLRKRADELDPPSPRTPAACAAAEVIERVAALNSADPVTDDLTVHLAVELADKHRELAQLRAQVEDARKQAFAEAMDELDKLRTLAATDFKSPNCQGQRGMDRTDAFYDAYHAIRRLSDTSTDGAANG